MKALRIDKPGFAASIGAHLAVLSASLMAFTSPPLPASPESIAVEVITDNQLSQITKGEKTAKEVKPDPKPRAERQADIAEIKDPLEAKRDNPAPPKRPADMEVADKPQEAAPPELKNTLPPAVPPSRQAALAAEQKAKAEMAKASEEAAKQAALEEAEALEQAKARAKAQAEAKARAEAKAKAQAEAKALAEAKAAEEAKREAQEEAKREAQAKAEKARKEAAAKAAAEKAKAQAQAELASKFDADDIRKLLQSKEANSSSGSAAREVNRTASLGTTTGSALKLNPSQRDALIGVIQEQLHRCWSVPIAAQSAPKPPVPSLKLRLNEDGSLSAEPAVLNSSSDPLFRLTAESAARAARRCAPLNIPAKFQPFYQDWKELTVNFNPSEMG